MDEDKRKLLIVVEGFSEKQVFSPLSTLYSPLNFSIVLTQGDITSDKKHSRNNIKSCLGGHVNLYLKKYKLRKQDIIKVWLITDTDGTFIPDDNIEVQDSQAKFCYMKDRIICNNFNEAQARNQRKKANLLELLKTKMINGIPLEIFFMSCNLDHVICDKANCTPEEKDAAAENFASKYDEPKHRLQFEHFFFERLTERHLPEDYDGSWKYIQQDLNSLQRCSNLYVALKELDAESRW